MVPRVPIRGPSAPVNWSSWRRLHASSATNLQSGRVPYETNQISDKTRQMATAWKKAERVCRRQNFCGHSLPRAHYVISVREGSAVVLKGEYATLAGPEKSFPGAAAASRLTADRPTRAAELKYLQINRRCDTTLGKIQRMISPTLAFCRWRVLGRVPV